MRGKHTHHGRPYAPGRKIDPDWLLGSTLAFIKTIRTIILHAVWTEIHLGFTLPGGSTPLRPGLPHSLSAYPHFSQSLEAAPDQFTDAAGSTFQLIGNRFVAEADDPQVDGVLLAWRKSCQVALHRPLQFPVEIDFLGIKVRAGMSRQEQIEIRLRILQIPPSGALMINRQIVSYPEQPVAGAFRLEIRGAMGQQS